MSGAWNKSEDINKPLVTVFGFFGLLGFRFKDENQICQYWNLFSKRFFFLLRPWNETIYRWVWRTLSFVIEKKHRWQLHFFRQMLYSTTWPRINGTREYLRALKRADVRQKAVNMVSKIPISLARQLEFQISEWKLHNFCQVNPVSSQYLNRSLLYCEVNWRANSNGWQITNSYFIAVFFVTVIK